MKCPTCDKDNGFPLEVTGECYACMTADLPGLARRVAEHRFVENLGKDRFRAMYCGRPVPWFAMRVRRIWRCCVTCSEIYEDELAFAPITGWSVGSERISERGLELIRGVVAVTEAELAGHGKSASHPTWLTGEA